MRALLDTNIVLDIILRREPWFSQSAAFREALRAGLITGYASAAAVTDIYYIARRLAGLAVAHTAVETCLAAFEICAVNRGILERAVARPGSDSEDNVQMICAVEYRLDAIMTRDAAGFRGAPLPIWSPEEAVQQLRRR